MRATINRTLFPSGSYLLFERKKRNLNPISSKFGFDRGTPIDRFWIENFLSKNQKYIKGKVLEITDSKYSKKYGKDRITHIDALDININNTKANIHGDLRDLKGIIGNNQYDCIILTHVLGLIDNYESAIEECRRIIKPGGVLLFTGSCLGPILENNDVYWRFTPNSVKFIMEKYFKPKSLLIESYGNVLAGQAFWVGMAQEDLAAEELKFQDKRFPCVVSAIVTK